MNKKFINYIVSVLIIYLVSVSPAVAGSETSNLLNNVATGQTGPFQPIAEGQNDIATIVGTIIEAFLSILGIIFLIYILYAGYTWMTAQGDEQKVTKAKDTIQRAALGLIVVIAAYAITQWVIAWFIYESEIMT